MEPYLGQISLFAGNFAPENWLPCDGRSLNTNDYSQLYALIGNTYGGSGTQFNLPDLRGRTPISQGTGPKLTPRILAQAVGSPFVTLATPEMPAHTHALQASTEVATGGEPAGQVLATVGNQFVFYIDPSAGAPVTTAPLSNAAVQPAFSSQQHENRMPGVALTYIIAFIGIWPQQP